jgi:hypothetical protein
MNLRDADDPIEEISSIEAQLEEFAETSEQAAR